MLGAFGLDFSTEEGFDEITIRPVLLGRVFQQRREFRRHLIEPESLTVGLEPVELRGAHAPPPASATAA
jgi:hypothetical protein